MPEQAKVIRKRIKSVSSTKKITKTMEMVAGAKLRVAQQRVQSSGPYLDQLRALMREIGASGIDVGRWPHFEIREVKRTLLFVITANRGLCGAFNANLIRRAGGAPDRVLEAMSPDVREEYLTTREQIAKMGENAPFSEYLFKKALAYEYAFVKAGGLLARPGAGAS